MQPIPTVKGLTAGLFSGPLRQRGTKACPLLAPGFTPSCHGLAARSTLACQTSSPYSQLALMHPQSYTQTATCDRFYVNSSLKNQNWKLKSRSYG